LLALLVAACGDAANGADAGTDAGPSDLTADAGAGDAGADAGIADAGDTWTSYAQDFFATYCTSCHSVGAEGDPTARTGLDFTQYAQVQANGPAIQCGVAVTQPPTWNCSGSVAPEQFPICNTGCTNQKPTDPERIRLVDWISAGMPQ
jgi:hypothetical protein